MKKEANKRMSSSFALALEGKDKPIRKKPRLVINKAKLAEVLSIEATSFAPPNLYSRYYFC